MQAVTSLSPRFSALYRINRVLDSKGEEIFNPKDGFGSALSDEALSPIYYALEKHFFGIKGTWNTNGIASKRMFTVKEVTDEQTKDKALLLSTDNFSRQRIEYHYAEVGKLPNIHSCTLFLQDPTMASEDSLLTAKVKEIKGNGIWGEIVYRIKAASE